MIESQTARIHWVKCDRCGTESPLSGTALDAEHTEREAMNEGWLRVNANEHYCPACAGTAEVCS